MRDSKKKIWNSIFTEYQFIRFKACIHFFQVKNLISVSSVEKHSVNLQIWSLIAENTLVTNLSHVTSVAEVFK